MNGKTGVSVAMPSNEALHVSWVIRSPVDSFNYTCECTQDAGNRKTGTSFVFLSGYPVMVEQPVHL